MLKRVEVQKGEGIKMLRNEQGSPYPDGKFTVQETTFVRRRIKAKDLILITELKKSPSKVGK